MNNQKYIPGITNQIFTDELGMTRPEWSALNDSWTGASIQCFAFIQWPSGAKI